MKYASRFLPLFAAVLLASGCATAVLSGAGADDVASADEARITRSVRTLIYRDALLADTRIQVSTRNGVVTLRGKVNSGEELGRALSIAESVAGVRAVNIELRVNDTPREIGQ
ncbi:MAG TPA: BON domain-containing protein [Gammaproteobacteria bacterium]